jgi:4'-phosphopantetheinyl transferase EntD
MSIRKILPADVSVSEVIGEAPSADLLPEESAALGSVAPIRRREFSLGRSCARSALVHLGVAPVPILVGPQREPLWPPDIVGSITHCAGYCGAAVSTRSRFIGIGVDAEPHNNLPKNVFFMIANDVERRELEALTDQDICWDRLLFSIKESIYKAFFPITRRWSEFNDATVTIIPATAEFTARLSVEGHIHSISGRFLVAHGHVFTSAVIPSPL